ncbi:MAG: YggS family pyridoxal phosphate-dependent enzyme [Syntrophobacteraceae bacterium]
MTTIAENVARVTEQTHAACRRCGRDPSSVTLVGVTKTVPVEMIREGVLAGISTIGENYVQEMCGKVEPLSDLDISWHFIGHLQSNKARQIVHRCQLIHTLDRESLARELDKQAQKIGRPVPVLIQVNVGDEDSKSGVSVEELPALYRATESMSGLQVRGLMSLPPYLEDAEEVRPYFRKLRHLIARLRDGSRSPERLTELSMGMSHDFEVAIEEGATFVRVGTALFGARRS